MRAWIAVAALAASFVAREARADLPGPMDYSLSEPSPGTVAIGLLSHERRQCPDQGLLRRDVHTGAVVKIVSCLRGSAGHSFVDECVPAGTYQYGLAEPYACQEPSSLYYREITVEGAAAGCVRSEGVPAPAPVEPPAFPWNGQGWVCTEAAGGCGPAGSAVLGTNLVLALAGLALWRLRSRPRTSA